jgi:hypothetical protein
MLLPGIQNTGRRNRRIGTQKPSDSPNLCRLGSGTPGLPAPGDPGFMLPGKSKKDISKEGWASGPGSSNKRFRSWLRTI